ncbi:hypothetical protein G3485_06345 [Shewanella baltica]|uniref:hypothetical protein n=1 Tax=Shewanella TaxID=22 RepID=UPI00217E87DD|nr:MULTISPECIES: hypothetical protein [Shewanella]MCS6126910.1 hypothetical protein [Shewanella baltica]MCS6138983.1 hypothetical protein [Shewanella baltica]MCS6145172.1 hypothetical protein [Shewanella baltica]MCS6169702.1 hypothetical protein [Shewanella baltica]MCS6186926.1 hypothetical protein [Shewanella baltica]
MEKLKCAICNEAIAKNNLWKHLVNVHHWSVLVSPTTSVITQTSPVFSNGTEPISVKQQKKNPNKISPDDNLIAWAKKQPVLSQHSKSYHELLKKPLSYLVDEQVRLTTIIKTKKTEVEKELQLKRLVLISHALEHLQKQLQKKQKAKSRAKALTDLNRQLGVKAYNSSSDLMDQYRGGNRLVCSGGLPSLGKKK